MSQAITRPLPNLDLVDRSLVRLFAGLATRHVHRVDGIANIMPHRDPFIFALNHSSKREALLIPALLHLFRGGARVHFLADWNFKLVPGVAQLYARGGVITVDQKRARPRWLETLRPFLVEPTPAHDRACDLLAAGRSIGIFPEGTVNRNPQRLLFGRRGAASLAVASGAPLVPAGLRRLGDGTLALVIGEPRVAVPHDVDATHASLMRSIADLSGKIWRPRS